VNDFNKENTKSVLLGNTCYTDNTKTDFESENKLLGRSARMSIEIKIEISDPATQDIVSRFRNFGEDVYRALCDKCTVDIEEIDRATTSFVVRDVRSREIGGVTQLIKKELRRHNFINSATLVRL
jgi:hypothetical protein